MNALSLSLVDMLLLLCPNDRTYQDRTKYYRSFFKVYWQKMCFFVVNKKIQNAVENIKIIKPLTVTNSALPICRSDAFCAWIWQKVESVPGFFFSIPIVKDILEGAFCVVDCIRRFFIVKDVSQSHIFENCLDFIPSHPDFVKNCFVYQSKWKIEPVNLESTWVRLALKLVASSYFNPIFSNWKNMLNVLYKKSYNSVIASD